MIVSIDGELVPPERAVISVHDRGLLYGDGVFEVLRAHGREIVDEDAHLALLAGGAAALQLPPPDPRLRLWLRAAVAAAALPDARVRVVLTRGPGPLSARLAELRGGRAIVVVEPLPPQPAAISLAVVDLPIPPRPPHLGGHKTLAYLDHVLARELAAAAGADEAVRLDATGHVAEGATSNLFVVRAGAVTTPDAPEARRGTIRARVLEACARAPIRCEARPVALAELRAADEIFVTSSLRGLVPVTRLDDRDLAAGPVTARIVALL